MNQLQQTELKMLVEFIHICEELKLEYFLVCGSALGAVKYSGFIHWDDDIDVGMPRRDYERFLNEAPGLLPKHIFLQNYRTDPTFPQVFSKLRNSDTTFIEKSSYALSINHGVYIDIFPLDGYPGSRAAALHIENMKKIYRLKAASAFTLECSRKAKIFFEAERVLGIHKRTQRTMKKYDLLISKYDPYDSAIWCNHGNWQGKLEYAPKEQYGDGTWATFEGLKVRIPEKYDEYLTQKYGDWRAELPVEQQVGHHYVEVIDLNRPYTDYIVPLGKRKIRLKTAEELKRDGIDPPKDYDH